MTRSPGRTGDADGKVHVAIGGARQLIHVRSGAKPTVMDCLQPRQERRNT
jgi:hypothetical protein